MEETHLENLCDKRKMWETKHNIHEIIIMVICAIMAECASWCQIEQYCREKESWFCERIGLRLANGVPSHATFKRIFSLIDPKALEACFHSWIRQATQKIPRKITTIGDNLQCGNEEDERCAIHMVSTWVNSQKIVLGEILTDVASNEIAAIPQLLDMLDIKDRVVTIDAIGCQNEIIIEKIMRRQAKYVLRIKENQPELCEALNQHFSDAEHGQTTVMRSKSPGRVETRQFCLATNFALLDQKTWWPKPGGIAISKLTVIENGCIWEKTRHYLTSLTEVNAFAKATYEHCHLENSLHWVLVAAVDENQDLSMYSDHSDDNIAVIRDIAVRLLTQDSSKMSLLAKRHRCAYDDVFLEHILFRTI